LKRPTAEDLGRRFGVSLKLPEDLGGATVCGGGGQGDALVIRSAG